MNRTIPSIISFIILIQRKYVVINSAKSLFMRVRSKGFRPDTFKPKKEEMEKRRLSCNSWGIKFSQFPSCIYLC